MNLYKRIVNIGTENEMDAKQQKRISLLNTYVFIWIHLSVFFITLDVIFLPPNTKVDILIHLISISFLGFLLLLSHKNQFSISRVLFIVFSFTVFYILSFVITYSPYTVCYFVFLPLIVMSLYKSNTPAYVFLIICLLIYNLSDLWTQDIIDQKQRLRILLLLKDPVVTSLFIAGFALFHYFKKMNQSNEQKLEEAYHKLEESQKGELAHLQLKSLKAQMNPHFMFNAINSIQSLVLKDQKHEAYQYMSKFSEMIRGNLMMSEKSFVTVGEELSLLKKYLELEKLRFKPHFEYELLGIEKIEEISIPSMIIQPFVENAIKHGLFHKENGTKRIQITFNKTDVFTCTIIDNGIGLKRALEIKEKHETDYNSFSTRAIEQRLEFLNTYYETNIGFEYIPIKVGTKVVVKIPYNQE